MLNGNAECCAASTVQSNLRWANNEGITMKRIFCGLVIIFAAGAAHAYTSKGAQGCGVYVGDFDKGGWEKIANGGWLVGVLTGYNIAMNSGIGKDVDIRSIELHVYNYCKINPLKNTADAAEDLILNLK